jgi:hypothetical protein
MHFSWRYIVLIWNIFQYGKYSTKYKGKYFISAFVTCSVINVQRPDFSINRFLFSTSEHSDSLRNQNQEECIWKHSFRICVHIFSLVLLYDCGLFLATINSETTHCCIFLSVNKEQCYQCTSLGHRQKIYELQQDSFSWIALKSRIIVGMGRMKERRVTTRKWNSNISKFLNLKYIKKKYKQCSSLSRNKKVNLFRLYYSRFFLSYFFFDLFCEDLSSLTSL